MDLFDFFYLLQLVDGTVNFFRQLGSKTPGHPEIDQPIGIETTTGPLGQGFATGVGMAIAEEHLRAKFGTDLVAHRVYGFVSDGETQNAWYLQAVGALQLWWPLEAIAEHDIDWAVMALYGMMFAVGGALLLKWPVAGAMSVLAVVGFLGLGFIRKRWERSPA